MSILMFCQESCQSLLDCALAGPAIANRESAAATPKIDLFIVLNPSVQLSVATGMFSGQPAAMPAGGTHATRLSVACLQKYQAKRGFHTLYLTQSPVSLAFL
jgi:hypothetical protein